MARRNLIVPCTASLYSDAKEWGFGYLYEKNQYIVIPRARVECLVATTFMILLHPEKYRAPLRTARRIASDPVFRRAYNYTKTVITLSPHERAFLQDYCTKHRIPIRVALTAGYVLLKNIVLRGYVPNDFPEELVYALRELRCSDAMQIFLENIPDKVYQKYFIDYVPGFRRCWFGRCVDETESEM